MKDIYIEDSAEEYEAETIGTHDKKRCTIQVRYRNGFKQILYNADPICKHLIKPQWSGIKCIKCDGWYCA